MHTLARLRGFGLTVVPYAPYCIRRIGDGADDRISVEHAATSAVLDPNGPPAVGALAEVADVAQAESDGRWLVDFGRFAVSWPNGFSLASSELDGVPFEWWGEEGASILVQGPFDPAPDETQLTAADQVVVDRGTATGGTRWFELHYSTDDTRDWTQRHYVLPTGHIITGQVLRGNEQLVMPVAERLGDEMLASTA